MEGAVGNYAFFMCGQRLRIGLPSGSLQDATLELFAKAGFWISSGKRSYKPSVDDSELEIRLLRAQEISRYVERGFLDCGITGKDWIAENDSQIVVIADLPYSKASSTPARWVLVVPENSPFHSVADLEGKRIATQAVGLTKRLLAAKAASATVEFSWGATEVKVPQLVDAIVDITAPGASLQPNTLRIIETVVESFLQIIGNIDSMKDSWKRSKVEPLRPSLERPPTARNKVGLKM